MPNALNKEELLRRNLLDAGCNEALTEECLCRFRKGAWDRMLIELSAYRKSVLLDIRRGQKQLDCLDYMINKIKSNKYGGTEHECKSSDK